MSEGQNAACDCSSESTGGKTSPCKEGSNFKNDSSPQLNVSNVSIKNDPLSNNCHSDTDNFVPWDTEMCNAPLLPTTVTTGCKDEHCESRETSYRNLLGAKSQASKNLRFLEEGKDNGNTVPNEDADVTTVELRCQDAIDGRTRNENAPCVKSDATTEIHIASDSQPFGVEAKPQPSGKGTVDCSESEGTENKQVHGGTSKLNNNTLQNGTGSDPQGQAPEAAIDDIVTAIDSFTALDHNQLSFKRGDQIHVISKESEEWWWAELNGCYGYIPVNHVSPKTLEELESELWQDDEYFGSYSSLKLQLEMLNDRPRTLAYRTAIERNADFLKDKVVMDLGCGTGILSLFCARYGRPKKIYAVEASRMADKAKRLVLYNGYWDIVKVIHSRVESITLPEKVDLIISEWMGTLLLFELMVESVLIARDKFLARGGVMWPSHAKLYLVPCSAQKQYDEKIACWEDQYGFDFSPLIPAAKKEFFGRPIFNHELGLQDCLAVWETVLVMDMKRFRVEELEEISQDFEFQVTREGTFHGFASWFSVEFGGFPSNEPPVVLNTGPEHEMTHWKQDLFMMDQPTPVQEGDSIVGSILIKRNPEWRRHLRVTFTWEVLKAGVKWGTQSQKQFLLWR